MSDTDRRGPWGPRGYPRPQLVREGAISLDGPWAFALDPMAAWRLPGDVEWTDSILVPFAPETRASGIEAEGFFRACWYGRDLTVSDVRPDDRLVLRFGAVDYRATVWIDGTMVSEHEGGHTPFSADVTSVLSPDRTHHLVVRAEDDPHDLAKPRGKQDWQRTPHSIWYPRTTGIWQSVWLERLPGSHIEALRWTSNLEGWEIGLQAVIDGGNRDDLRLQVRLTHGERLIADDTYAVLSGEVDRRIALPDPGIDDFRNELLWSPSTPTLIDAEFKLWGHRGELIDRVTSYTALRSVGVQGDRFILNGRPFRLRMVLDQGYWPDTGMTAPDDDALRQDVVLAKLMGFNGVRKHQKVEDPRYLHWADRHGLLVWEEMPSAYRFTRRSIERLTREWLEVIARDASHPCIVAWVPFNESWGVPDLPSVAAQRHAVQALYHLTKTLDPTRPVIGNDGWESSATDIVGIHDYDADVKRIAHRYEAGEAMPHLFKRERPGGRLLTLEGYPHEGQPIMLTEFGGMALSDASGDTWGYTRREDAEAFLRHYRELLAVVRELPLLAGFCYTQFADTYQEANGLLRADRTPKVPLRDLALATAGSRHPDDDRLEQEWQARSLALEGVRERE
ncbi:MAG: glycoside hydrolase family 2 [Trueperaceae bacterium]|nr:glycoside hydrolase family 2 [Trueperaceae bacterium]